MDKYMEQLKEITKKIIKPPILRWVIGGIILVAGLLLIWSPAKDYTPSAEILQAQELYSQGKIQESKAKYEFILRKEPKNILALNSLGNIWRDMGNLEKAEVIYLEAIKIDPRYEYVYRNIVTIYQLWEDETVQNEKLIAFEPIMKRGISLNKNKINIIDAAVTYYKALGNLEEANRLKEILDNIE